MADKTDHVEATLQEIEPHRRTLYVAGAVLTAVSTIGVFVTWDYPGIFCALAAGAIACDSFSSKERARARLTGRLGPCGNLRTGQGSCCCNDSCEPLCGAPLHIYGLLITALLFASIFIIAAIATVASLRWNHDFFCAGYTTQEAYRSACPAGGATGRNSSAVGPGYNPWDTDCARWEQCSWLLYSYTISSLSIVVHLVLLTAGGVAMGAYNKMRRIAAGSPLVTMVGTGVCCTPGTLPLPAGFPGGGAGIGRPDAAAGGAPMTRMNEEA